MSKENDFEATLLLRKEEILKDIEDTFSVENMLSWVNQFDNSQGREESDLIGNVRKITLHPTTKLLYERQVKSKDYLIPDASWASISEVGNDIPRNICMDAGMLAGIMVQSRIVDHGLKEQELEDIYLHHCLKIMLNVGRAHQTNDEETVKILHYYVKRITFNLFK